MPTLCRHSSFIFIHLFSARKVLLSFIEWKYQSNNSIYHTTKVILHTEKYLKYLEASCEPNKHRLMFS